LIPQKGEEKDTTEGTIRISAKPPHQTNHMLNNQEEGKTQVAPLIENQ